MGLEKVWLYGENKKQEHLLIDFQYFQFWDYDDLSENIANW